MLQGSEALYAAGGAGGMFAFLFILLATSRLWTWVQVRQLMEDRDRWRAATEALLPAVQANTTGLAEVATLVRSLDTRIAQQAAERLASAQNGGRS